MDVERVAPEPEPIFVGDDIVTPVFAAEHGSEDVEVTFTLRLRRSGVHSAEIVAGSRVLSFWQFAHP